jgi:polyhydroxyalkanoate synthesis regulator phasin
MAKDADQDPTGRSRADQLRSAVEGAFSATTSGAAPVQKRAQDLADELVDAARRLRGGLVGGDELVSVAARVRETLGVATGGVDVADELTALRAQVEALEARVAELENRKS